MKRVGAWLLSVLLAASCALPSADEFSSGTGKDAGTQPDGGVLGDGSSTSEAGAALVDGATNNGTDARTDVCAGDFCSTFDSPAALADYEESSIVNGGTVVVQDGQLRASIPAITKIENRPEAAYVRTISRTSRKAAIELDMRVEHGDFTGLDGNATVLYVDCLASGYSNIQVYVGQSYSQVVPLRDNGAFESDRTSPNIPRAANIHVRLEFDFDPVKGSYRLFFDGSVVASRSNYAFGNAGEVQRLRIQLGVQTPNPPAPLFDVRYDNVVVDLQ